MHTVDLCGLPQLTSFHTLKPYSHSDAISRLTGYRWHRIEGEWIVKLRAADNGRRPLCRCDGNCD